MKNFIFRHFGCIAIACIAGLGTAACDDSDDDSWEPGPAVPEGSMGAYFAEGNTTELITTPEEFAADPTFSITVARPTTEGTASAAIEVVDNEGGMTVPASVEFADGADRATLTIDYSAVEPYRTHSLKLRIAASDANPYAISEGIDTYTGTVLVSQWVKVAADVEFTFSAIYSPVRSDIHHLDGVNLFRIDNFIGSGLDLRFSISGATGFDADDPATWVGDVNPLSNVYWDEYGYWWLIDEEADDYASWTIGDAAVAYVEFNPASGYNPISFAKGTLLMTAYMFQDDTNAGWNYVRASWGE